MRFRESRRSPSSAESTSPTGSRHYGRVWTGTQVGALTIDAVDKADSVLTYFHQDIPGYDQLKEQATKAIPGL